jgi:hypothetical protein
MFIGAFVIVGVIGLVAGRRLLSQAGEELNAFTGVMAGVMAAVYGVFLAFAIVAVYQEFHEAEENVRTEAVALARIARDSDALPAAAAARVHASVRDYRDAVVGPEWDAMQDGRSDPRAWAGVDRIFAAVQAYDPKGNKETAFYGETATAVNDLVEARRARLHGGESALPTPLMTLLVAGALLTLGFTVMFVMPDRRVHTAMVVSLAALLGLSLVVAIVLDLPYSGDIRVSTAPYFDGALGRV